MTRRERRERTCICSCWEALCVVTAEALPVPVFDRGLCKGLNRQICSGWCRPVPVKTGSPTASHQPGTDKNVCYGGTTQPSGIIGKSVHRQQSQLLRLREAETEHAGQGTPGHPKTLRGILPTSAMVAAGDPHSNRPRAKAGNGVRAARKGTLPGMLGSLEPTAGTETLRRRGADDRFTGKRMPWLREDTKAKFQHLKRHG
jgi:hypothetical protein